MLLELPQSSALGFFDLLLTAISITATPITVIGSIIATKAIAAIAAVVSNSLATVPSIVGDTLGVVSETVTMAPVPLCLIV